MSRPKRRRRMAPDDASDNGDSASCSGEVENVSFVSKIGRKRKPDSSSTSCTNTRNVSREDSKLDLLEMRARARIKARIKGRIKKAKEVEEQRLAALRVIRENGWTDLVPYEVLLRIFRLVVSDHGPVPFLCRMSRVCRNWKQVASESMLWQNVNLSRMSSEFPKSATDSNIGKLAASKLKGAREISLDGWSELTDVGLRAIGKHCRHLQSIVLSQCGSVTSKGIASLATKCRQMKMLDVAMTKIDIACLHRVSKRLGSQLQELCLMNCGRLGGEQILPIIQNRCPKLTVLDVTGTNIRKLNVEKLQAGCPLLKEFFAANLLLHSTPLSADVEQNGFQELETLCLACGSLAGVPRSDRLLFRILRTSTNLKKLDVRGLQRITPEGLQRLPVTSLEELYFSDTHANSGIMSIAAEKWHHSLAVLDVSSNSGINDQSLELFRNFGMPKMQTLDLSSTNVTGEGVRKAMLSCPKLKRLNLTSCRGVPRGLKQWHDQAKLSNLQAALDGLGSD